MIMEYVAKLRKIVKNLIGQWEVVNNAIKVMNQQMNNVK